MKRKASYLHWFWEAYSKDKVAPELLKAVGHLSFLWNDIEEALDRAVVWALEVPPPLQVEIRSRMAGLEAKIEVVKTSINSSEHFAVDVKADLLKTAGAFQALKERRDAVIHAKASEIFDGIARTFERRGAVYEVLLTVDALGAVNAHLEIYAKEMAALAGVLGVNTAGGRAMKKALQKDDDGPNAELMRAAATADQRYLETLRMCQAGRKALPPLPELKQAAPPAN
jgi:hypothetical protein